MNEPHHPHTAESAAWFLGAYRDYQNHEVPILGPGQARDPGSMT